MNLRERARIIAWPLLADEEFRGGRVTVDVTALRSSLRSESGLQVGNEVAEWRHGEGVWSHFRRHAAGVLIPDGGRAGLRVDLADPGREILWWRELSLVLPTSILALASSSHVAPTRSVRTGAPGLTPVSRVAVVHVHEGAAIEFETMWGRFLSDQPDNRVLRRVPFGGGSSLTTSIGARSDWGSWLARVLIALRVVGREMVGGGPALTGVSASMRAACCDDIVSGRLSQQSAFQERRIWAAAWPSTRNPQSGIRPTIGELDRIMRWGLAREDVNHTIVLQCLRIKCMMFSKSVMDPRSPGLPSFEAAFRQMKTFSRATNGVPLDFQTDAALEVGSLELRKTPDSVHQVVEFAAKFHPQHPKRAGVCAEAQRREIALVLHLERTDRSVAREREAGTPALAGVWRQLRRQADYVVRALRRAPTILYTLRGVDLAGRERDSPLWLALPHLRAVRDASRLAAASHDHPLVCPLRFALHAGEDFAHLATGLRAVHEPVLWRLLERGDHIGHATALGVDAAEWVGAHELLRQPRLERVQDLAWLVATVGDLRLDVNAGHLRALEEELERGASAIWRRSIRASEVVELWRRLGDPSFLQQIGYPMHRRATSVGAELLLAELLFDPKSWKAGREYVEVRVVPEDAPLLAEVQRRILRLVARMSLLIEVNPTSSQLIAGMAGTLGQKLFHSLADGPESHLAVPVAIGPDDPVIFATRLADEYAFAWAGMVVNHGRAPGYATRWIEQAAANSWAFRFSMPFSEKVPHLPLISTRPRK